MTSASVKALGSRVLIFLAWASVLAQAFTHFDPGSLAVTGWNSDSAITVLQSNDPVFDAFRLYYYGQDRFGAWPWLAAQGWRALTGFDWTPYRLFLWHATWACTACLALLGLHRRVGLFLAAGFAALALLSPLFQLQLFAINQPYGWQLTALLLAWWTLTRFIEALAAPSPTRATWGWGAAATVFTTMACWISPTSGPLLLVCLMVQGCRAGVLSPPGRGRWRLLGSLVPLAAGIGFEAWVRHVYHRFAKHEFGYDYRTSMQLDNGYLLANTRAVFGRVLEHELAPLVLFGWAAGFIALAFLLFHLRRRTLAGQTEQAELAALTLAFAGAALANAVITLLVRHARLNEHDIRYLVPTFALGVLAAAAGFFFLLGQVPQLRTRLGALSAFLAVGVIAGSHLLMKPRVPEPLLALAQETTDAVVARAAGTVLLGGYWDSYILGALDPEHRLPTVAIEMDQQRTPFWVPQLREAREILVSFIQNAQEPWAGTLEQPNPWLLQYGVPFQLADARWAVHPPFLFARYRNEREHTLPVRLTPERGFKPCKPGASLTVNFEQPFERGLLLVSTRAPAGGIDVEAPGAAEARLEALPNVWLLHLSTGAQPLRQVTLRVRPDVVSERCEFSGVALVTGAPLASIGAAERD
ncbi:hypothetical protein [Vitiosangium sp. GDMCC 1.1324]|uniref:hypothetical protein n=1 Tax=Vitiosangium sp. (strain GDMCC 1.1324) TaxID=2138576 RepID=UPI000D3D67C1|nr:hypothetical protein [Vitiosangium sp. GDMCC 1.1324]PTL82020.1 hypothetical protein DAT35_19605 [Vitiosangium sp. GDMCC 1.1324]